MHKKINFWYAIVFFIIYMAVCFLMPSFMVGDFEEFKKEEKVAEGKMIKLLNTETNTISDILLEDYIKGVLIGEMPVDYDIEALKAQAVVARTYTMYKLKNAVDKHPGGADMCDDINCCQAYKTKEYAFACWDDETREPKWNKIEQAINETSGEYITYDGEIINAFFHAHSGGKTESVNMLWSKTSLPYLVSVDGMEKDSFLEQKSFTKDEFKNLVSALNVNYEEGDKLEIKDYTGSGRVNILKIGEKEIEGAVLRSKIGIRSTNFRIEENENEITFYTVGYGHGVGMSQVGANQMAQDGCNYQDIIKHYYKGVEIKKSV